MIISRLVFFTALATCFLLGAASAGAQDAPRVANLVTFEGPTPKILEFGKRAAEISAKLGTTGTTRWWVSGLSGTNTGRLAAVIEYPDSVSMAQSRAKNAASPEWQKFVADFQAAGLRVISSSEIIEVKP